MASDGVLNDRTEPTRPTEAGGVAPADARPHRRWPAWQIVTAYILLAAFASFAIWYIDHGVDPALQQDVPAAK